MRIPGFLEGSALARKLTQIFQGNISFGDGVDFDNIKGKWMTYATNGVANTEDAITHNLGVIPVGMIVMVPPQNGFIYTGPTAWTTTQIFLKCSQASQTATIFLVLPPSET